MANKKILVSIIIPVYNAEDTLRKCLDSIRYQTYKDIEILCIDDASCDSSLSILQEYAQNDSRVRVFHHEINKNAGGAYNTGIRNAQGEYICFVDNDDWLREDAIELLVEASEGGVFDIVAPQWCEVDAEGHETNHQNYVIGIDREASIKHLILNGGRMMGVIFRRSMVIDNNVFYPENLFWEDNAIGVCFFLPSKTMKVISDVLYFYYVGVAASSSRSISYKKIVDRVKSTDLFIENVKIRGFYEKYSSEIDKRFMDFSAYTLVLLKEISFKKARPLAEHIQECVATMLPNKYFDDMTSSYQYSLQNSVNYVKQERRKLILSKIKGFFHGIRHAIVIIIKKMLGMDPTKSVYNK